jgi:predicted sulfurtransferase
MESLDLIQQWGLPPSQTCCGDGIVNEDTIVILPQQEFLFHNIDWKISTTTTNSHQHSNNVEVVDPFPDLKISIVTEIISSGNQPNSTTTTATTTTTGITLQDMMEYGGGIHVSPTEFHNMIEQEDPNNILLFDIRNTFEYQIGHFVHPQTQQSAIHPKDMVQFSTLPSILQQTIFQNTTKKNEEESKRTTNNNESNAAIQEQSSSSLQQHGELRNKKILLYCTGGIRCEKASVMFQKFLSESNSGNTTANNNHVYQLSGGIHRYIEQYGSKGYFKGKNFVFDQRIVQYPSDYDDNNGLDKLNHQEQPTVHHPNNQTNNNENDPNIVGQCIECHHPYDVLCGSRICTVCRDLVLICTTCQTKLREYHCSRHQIYKTCYYTFLEVYTKDELQHQYDELTKLRDGFLRPQQDQPNQETSNQLKQEQISKKYRNVRRTLFKQMMKVQDRIHDLENGMVQYDRNAARRCRTCFEPYTICDGKCWGFWKRSEEFVDRNGSTEPRLPLLTIGTIVEPGPHWNEIRFGSKYEILSDRPTTTVKQSQQPTLRRGCVVDVKTWGSNSTEYDSVAVSWFPSSSSSSLQHPTKVVAAAPLIYRWGVLARNGQRMYDLQRVVE